MANILIIDDKPYVRELLEAELSSEGYLVEMSDDAESISQLLTSSKPDLVLLELHIKRNDRWDVLRDIKEQVPNLPVLIVTAYDGYRKDPRFALADGCVIKSMYFDELKQRVTEILHRKAESSVYEESKALFPHFNMAHY
jgi:DNA-binding response OmpR family regulator